jgi:hypothetical protein
VLGGFVDHDLQGRLVGFAQEAGETGPHHQLLEAAPEFLPPCANLLRRLPTDSDSGSQRGF